MNTVAPLLLELADTTASGREIALSVAGFDVRGQLALERANLHLAGRDGTVTAERIVITNVTMSGHGVRLGGQELEAAHATVGWGHHGLRVEATTVIIRAVQLIGDDEPFDGTLVLEGITLSDLAVHGDDVRVGHLRIAATQAEAKLAPRQADGQGEHDDSRAGGASAILERLWPVLDRLTGHVNVDLGLDLTVPVIGRRRATHHFRIPVEGGTINYRQLEDNLSTLEDSLLDFSVRDEGLVLEVGIPFIPTRGKGKPIVTWSLDGQDLALAHQQRVRLSVLGQPDRSGNSNGNTDASSSNDGDGKSSPVALRRADVRGLDVSLAIAPAPDSPIRRVGLLVVTGDMTYGDDAVEGVIRGGAQDVELADIHAGRIDLAGVRLDSASDVEVGFLGASPVRARVVARSLQIDGLHLRSKHGIGDAAARGDSIGGAHAHVPHAKAD